MKEQTALSEPNANDYIMNEQIVLDAIKRIIGGNSIDVQGI